MPFVSSVRGTFGPQAKLRKNFNSAMLNSISGGSVTTAGGYRIHTYTTTGNSTFTLPAGGLPVEYLVIGGGGGSGPLSGGAGAGGFVTGTINVTQLTSTVTVGEGGTSWSPYSAQERPSGKGGNSVFSSVTAQGGGAGGGYNTSALNFTTSNGGSGGGSGAVVTGGGGGAGAKGQDAIGSPQQYQGAAGYLYPGPTQQGHPGGYGAQYYPYSGTRSGAGGNGLSSSISGSAITYAGGGGGGGHPTPGHLPSVGNNETNPGGSGGGGYGVYSISANGGYGQPGTNNRGGGGGGSGHSPDLPGGNGGTGIVIVRYQV